MTDTSNTALAPVLPNSIDEADKILRKRVLKFALVIGVLLFIAPMSIIILQFKLAEHHMQAPLLMHILTYLSIGIVMVIFFTATNRLARTLIAWGRNFVERCQWEDAETILSTFNQGGQRFLDPTGEGHYLLATALHKRGKYEKAQKVRDFVTKYRATSEWAQKIAADDKSRAVPTPSKRSDENQAKPSKSKRRRY